MKKVLAALRALPPIAILALGLVIPFLYGFPGMMTQDSFDLLIEARAGVFTDAHPPINAALWRMLDGLVAGGILWLVIQLVAFEVGLYLIFRRTFTPKKAAWIAAALFLYPPILAPMGMIWKDCLMAAMLALGTGALLCNCRAARIGGLVALFFATAVRYNAFPAVFPIVILLFEWRPGMRALHRYAIAFAAWLAITAAAFGINAALTDREMHYWHSTLAIYDIAGVLANLDEDLTDPQMEELLAGTDPVVHHDMHRTLRALYSPREFFPLTSPEGKPFWDMPLYGVEPPPPAKRAAIEALWWKLVSEHPGAYLAHRLDATLEVLCLGEQARPIGAIPRRIPIYVNIARDLGLNTGWSRLQRRMSHLLIDIWETVPIFAPWIYVVIALAMMWLARKHRDVLALLASGLLVEATLFVLAHSPDYRYSHWLIVATAIAVITLVARRSRPERT